SEGVLVVWRVEKPIELCLGFALHREVLGDTGIVQDVVGTRLGFRPAPGAPPGGLLPSPQQPIQNFRWLDREEPEGRYRVVPSLGTGGDLAEAAESAGSPWTGWVSPRTGQDPGCRAHFNAAARGQGLLRGHGAAGYDSVLRDLKGRRADLRSHLGAGLRQRL